MKWQWWDWIRCEWNATTPENAAALSEMPSAAAVSGLTWNGSRIGSA